MKALQSNTNPARFLPLLAATMAVSPFAIDTYLPAMPQIAEALSTDIKLLQNSLSVYLLGYAFGMFVFGPLVDKLGRKSVLLVGLFGYGLFSLLIADCDNGTEFIIYRFFQASFGGAATVVIPGAISALFGKDTSKGLSYVSIIMMIAPLIAPSIGALILKISDWRVIFVVLAFYATIIFILNISFFPKLESNLNTDKTFKTIYLSKYGMIFENRNCRPFLLVSMLASFTFFIFITGIAFVYMQIFKLSEFAFGLLFGVNVIVLMSINMLNVRLSGKIGSRRMISLIWFVAFLSAIFVLYFIRPPFSLFSYCLNATNRLHADYYH